MEQIIRVCRSVTHSLYRQVKFAFDSLLLVFERLWAYIGNVAGKGVRSLATRIMLLQLGWALVVYLLVIAALWYATSVIIESSFRNQGEGWIAKLDELGTPLYTSGHPAKPDDVISDLHRFNEIAAVNYFDASGQKVIADYHKKAAVAPGLPPLTKKQFNSLRDTSNEKRPLLFEKGEGNQLRITAPIRIKSIPTDGMLTFSLDKTVQEQIKVIGFVSVQLDYSHFYTSLNRTLRDASLVIAVLILFAVAIGRVLVRWALNPLLQLEEPLTRLANGETDVSVHSSGDREIAQIGIALNTTITAIRERDETLRRMANHDALTGLVTRNYFIEQVENEIERLSLDGGTSALYFIDLDRFKFINDTYGHAVGDRLLRQIADMLSQRMRENDLIARFGGDEFTALVANVGQKSAAEIAQSLLDLMNGFRFQVEDESLKIHFSIGVTLIQAGDATPNDYLIQADEAVHQAKLGGRNRYHVYSGCSDDEEKLLHTGWYERLFEAIQREDLRLHYQPLLNLKGGKGRFYEVLLRLPDKGNGLIPPGAFFPAAERFGLMCEIDRQVIRKAAAALRDSGLKDCVMSINVSEQLVEDEGFPAFLEEVISDCGVKPGNLIFEFSERLAIRNAENIAPLFAAINALGCGLAIDDFGAGYASFQYLKHSPVKWLKIDGALIEGLRGDTVDQVTVRAIAQAAAERGIETVAKFVPDQETLEMLQLLGIGYAQGDYLGRPGPELCTREMPKLKRVK